MGCKTVDLVVVSTAGDRYEGKPAMRHHQKCPTGGLASGEQTNKVKRAELTTSVLPLVSKERGGGEA